MKLFDPENGAIPPWFFEQVRQYNRRKIPQHQVEEYLRLDGENSLFSLANTPEALLDKKMKDTLWDIDSDISKPDHTYQNRAYGEVSFGDTWKEIDFAQDSANKAEIAWARGGYRETMEDAHVAKNIKIHVQGTPVKISVYGIFDGHGGEQCAKFIEKRLTSYLKEKFDQKCENHPLTDEVIFNILKRAFVDIGDEYRSSHSSNHRAGSTANVILIIGESLWAANVGDSRAIICAHGEPIALSNDQSPGNQRYKKGIEMRGGRVVPRGKLPDGTVVYEVREGRYSTAIARAVGHDELHGITAQAEIMKIPLSMVKGNIIVMACDGIWDVASSNEVAAAVEKWRRQGDSIKLIAEKIVKHAQNAGSMDNMSVLVLSG